MADGAGEGVDRLVARLASVPLRGVPRSQGRDRQGRRPQVEAVAAGRRATAVDGQRVGARLGRWTGPYWPAAFTLNTARLKALEQASSRCW